MNKPNIVFIISDDQGPWAAGCYGNAEIRTPAIDRIAQTGTRFDNFFVASPVCSPSRATFLTGRNPLATRGTRLDQRGQRRRDRSRLPRR